jgi:hypothetical protein|tara:strand:+ start:347 stop:604 length:258 start_codon:yes stop_codon:yes gene_type:complete
MNIFDWLKLPVTKEITDFDAPATTLLHAEIIKRKPFLKKLHMDFYNEFQGQCVLLQNALLYIALMLEGFGFLTQQTRFSISFLLR